MRRRGRVGRRRGAPWLGAAAATLASLLAAAARADGAFPDSQNILVPADRPGEILLAANFGLLISEDAGGSWTWSCEQAASANGRLYQLGPAPQHRLFAISAGQLIHSDDAACGWAAAGGQAGAAGIQDAFVDPTDGNRVLSVVAGGGDGGPLYTLLESSDGGTSLGALRYTAAAGTLILGVESARSDPATIYLALAPGGGGPALACSHDGGASWNPIDLSETLGSAQIRIIAVDPTNPERIYLRAIGLTDEALAIVDDGGETVTRPVVFSGGALWSFVRTAEGEILVGGTAAGQAVLYRSDDGGSTFAPATPTPPGLRAMAERDGVIYAATDNADDDFIEATSNDDGASWVPGLRTSQVAAIAACVASACQSDCAVRAGQGQWPIAMCSAEPPSGSVDASAGEGGAVRDAGTDDPTGIAADPGGPVGAEREVPSGCACRAGGGRGPTPTPPALLLLLLAALLAQVRPRR